MLKTFSTVANELAQFNVPSHIVDKKHKSVYVPLPGQDDVYLGVEWEKKVGQFSFDNIFIYSRSLYQLT